MAVNVVNNTQPEARLSESEVNRLNHTGSGTPVVVLEPEGLGSPLHWVSELPEAVPRIVIEYEGGGRPFERVWVLQESTPLVRYYSLVRDSSSKGYVSPE
jgi:hypothetical protein